MNVKKSIAVAISMVLITLTSPLSLTADNSASAETEIWDGTCDTSWYDEEEKELHISTAEELAGLSKLVNAGQTMEGQMIYLDNDIYLNDVSDFENWGKAAPANTWVPIGIFYGVFDGCGHTITGLYSDEHETLLGKCGMFELMVGTAELKNLNLHYGYINPSYHYSNMTVGGLVGDNRGVISNCSFSGKVESYAYYSSNALGTSTVVTSYAGGICGTSSGAIYNCVNYGDVISYSTKHYMLSSYAYLEHPSSSYAGGICGSNYGIITCSANCGSISADSASSDSDRATYAGGICGDTAVEINDCRNTGKIQSSRYAGGICGASDCAINNTYNVGNIEGLYCGAITGKNSDTETLLSNCYYLSGSALQGVGTGIDNAVAKNSTNMQKESFAESLGEAFVYNEGGYPLLAWELELQQELLMGDVNLDGIFDVADIKLLQDYLVCRETLTAEQGAVADVCTDGILDVFDLCILKRMYLEKSETA